MKAGVVLLVVVAVVLVVGTVVKRWAESQPPTDRECTVQFKRDSLGGSADIAGSPLTKVVNDVTLSVDGRIREVSAEWVCLESSRGKLWIPREVILLIQFE